MFELSRLDQEALIGLTQDLVRIPSASTREGEVAERLAQEMRDLGFDEVFTDRIGNVVGRIGPGKGPKLLYDGHMDTVGIGQKYSNEIIGKVFKIGNNLGLPGPALENHVCPPSLL